MASINTGAWAGAAAAVAATRAELLVALPWVLVLVPATWAHRRGGAIATKVLACWLVAIAVLAAMLQFLPVTPGYMPDHME